MADAPRMEHAVMKLGATSHRNPEADKRVAALALKARELDAVFSCGGSLEAPVALELRDGRTIEITRGNGWGARDVPKLGRRQIRGRDFTRIAAGAPHDLHAIRINDSEANG